MNLREVRFLDANWLHLIASSYLAAKDADAHLKLLTADDPKQKEVLRICKIDQIIECCDNEVESIASFRDAL